MKRVLFIQNGEYDRPGLFATALEAQGIALDTVHTWRGEHVPASPEGWAAVAVGGGSMSAYQFKEFPFIAETIALLKNARAAKLPVLGMCLGAQLMAAAFGGDVFPNRRKEIGFFDVRFTQAAKSDPLWSGWSGPFQPVHWHGDTFALPPRAVLLASSHLTPNQLFSLDGIHYGLQFHLEIDAALFAEMIATGDCGLPKCGVDPQGFLEAAQVALPKVEPMAREVFSRWTQLLA